MALKIIENLLTELHTHNINYCHWKSNENIASSVNANTDMDILFDYHQKEEVIKILKRNEYHLFNAVWYKKYMDIEDYIGFDKEEAKIVHIHTHFKLDLGEVGVKSYHLPWDDLILRDRIFNTKYNIYTSSPTIEYLLLVVRTAFKHDRIDSRSNQTIMRDYQREAPWLLAQVDEDKLKAYSEELLDDEIANLILNIKKKREYDKKLFWRLKKLLKPLFAEHRLLTKRRVFMLKFLHFTKKYEHAAVKKLFGIKMRKYRRTLPNKGLIVSLMGSDGSGKSTQSEAVTKELAKKVDVLFMYMGTGKGSKTFARKVTDKIFKFGFHLTAKELPQYKGGAKSFIRQSLLSFQAIVLGLERKNRLRKIDKERKRGGIIICDRYPQTSFLGINDGMKLYNNIGSKNFILRGLAKYEFKCYDLANKIAPDLVIKFRGDVEELHRRRPEMSKENHDQKQNGILNLNFPKQTKVVILEINEPVKKIKGRILQAISQQIVNQNNFQRSKMSINYLKHEA